MGHKFRFPVPIKESLKKQRQQQILMPTNPIRTSRDSPNIGNGFGALVPGKSLIHISLFLLTGFWEKLFNLSELRFPPI